MRPALIALAFVLLGPAAAEVVDIRQGTNLSLAVDPTGEIVVVDLLGGLWRLPISGGGATALIPPGSGIAQPRFDPTGSRVVFQRWLDGQWDLWQLTLVDGVFEPLTETPFNEREPDYSPDGSQIVYASDRTGEYRIWSLDAATGATRQLNDESGDSRFPTYAATGELAYTHRVGSRSTLRLFEGGARGYVWIDSDEQIDAPSWRPGGGVIVFNERVAGVSSDLSMFVDADEPIRRRLTRGEDVFVGRPAWISPADYLYAADGQIWRRGIASTERMPIHLFAGANVETVPAGNVTVTLDAAGPHRVAGVNDFAHHAASGRWAFSALGDLWLIDDGELSRLTDDAAADAWPAFTPDGEWLVFASDREGGMEIWRLRLDSGQTLALTSEPGGAFMPRVSPDGRFVAYLATAGSGPWDAADLRLVEIARPFDSRTLASELYDASELAWQGSAVRLLARAATAREPLPRVFETPASAIGTDSGSAPGSLPDVPPALDDFAELAWEAPSPGAPYVIQAGRIFDGIRDSYTYLIDIHIEGQRIREVVRRGQLPLPERVIDASDLTVVPGLIDVHAHHSGVTGAEPGRLWLAHGVTTVQEVMADAREAAERAETWASGRQPGPRLVISPASRDPAFALPAGSPIVLGSGARLAGGLPHDLAEQVARDGTGAAALPPVLVPGRDDRPRLAVSTLGLSYQDVIGQLGASGAWLPTGLAALAATDSAAGMRGLTTTIERIMRSSGRIAIGSDAPAVPYGSGFHDELALLAGQGIPPAQILRWATAGGAIALGLSLELGTIEAGRIADLVIVDGDPLDDIEELRRIEAVVRAGVHIDAALLSGAR